VERDILSFARRMLVQQEHAGCDSRKSTSLPHVADADHQHSLAITVPDEDVVAAKTGRVVPSVCVGEGKVCACVWVWVVHPRACGCVCIVGRAPANRNASRQKCKQADRHEG